MVGSRNLTTMAKSTEKATKSAYSGFEHEAWQFGPACRYALRISVLPASQMSVTTACDAASVGSAASAASAGFCGHFSMLFYQSECHTRIGCALDIQH